MSVPPPPNDAPPPGYGGGFGPPQGYGPPAAPQGYGGPPPGPAVGPPGAPYDPYGPPQDPYGYPQQGYPPYPPPQPQRGNGAKVAAFLAGAVVLMAIVIGTIVWLGSGYDDRGGARGGAAAPVSASPTPSGVPVGDGGQPSREPPSADPLPSHGYMPYVKLAPGSCFDSPSLNSRVNVITRTSCRGPHDGEVIDNEALSGSIPSEEQLRSRALALCAPDAKSRLRSIPDDGRIYYNYALYPDLTTYRTQGEDTVSCALTLSNTRDGQQLSEPLP